MLDTQLKYQNNTNLSFLSEGHGTKLEYHGAGSECRGSEFGRHAIGPL